MVKQSDMPWENPTGAVYDSGDYERCLRMAADAIDWTSHAALLARPVPTVESSASDSPPSWSGPAIQCPIPGQARVSVRCSRERHPRANRSGGIDLYTGISTMGQSSETAFAQVVAEVTGVAYDAVESTAATLVVAVEHRRLRITHHDRGGRSAATRPGASSLPRRCRIAAFALGRAVDEFRIDSTIVRTTTGEDAQITLADVFTRAIIGRGIAPDEEPGLEVTSHFEPLDAAYSYGTAAAVVAVDPATGDFDIERFVMVHDGGTVVNPAVVEGQVRGALAQGFGAALTKSSGTTRTGQLVNGSMMDYFVPTAADAAGRATAHGSALTGHTVRHPRRRRGRDDPARCGDRQRPLRRAV